MALVAYGAVILAFLGGVHWGFALPEPSGRGERARLVLGVVPSLVGWVALLLLVCVDSAAGLGLLLVGFIGTTVVEARANRRRPGAATLHAAALRAVRDGVHDPDRRAGTAASPASTSYWDLRVR